MLIYLTYYAQKDAYSSKTKKYVGCSVIPAPTIYQIYAQKKEYKKIVYRLILSYW